MLQNERAFERALSERGFEESSPGLSERIITNALGDQKAQQKSLTNSLKEIFSVFPIPSPAIALPLILLVGIVAGYLYTAEIAVSEPEGVQLAELIYNDGGFYE